MHQNRSYALEPGHREFHIIFGSRVREARKARKFTVRALAYLAGIRRRYLEVIECGQQAPSLEVAYRIAIAVRVSLTELVHGLSILEIKPKRKRHKVHICTNNAVHRMGKGKDVRYRLKAKARGYTRPRGFNFRKSSETFSDRSRTANGDGIPYRKRKKQTKEDAVPKKASRVPR